MIFSVPQYGSSPCSSYSLILMVNINFFIYIYIFTLSQKLISDNILITVRYVILELLTLFVNIPEFVYNIGFNDN